jgi:putative SOS response-associated peptidase YedK
VCGRYTNSGTSTRLLAERFDVPEGQIPPETMERANVCPTETILIVTGEGAERRALGVRWGLLPWWSRDGKGPQPLNARSETVASKRMFSTLLERNGDERSPECVTPRTGRRVHRSAAGRCGASALLRG